MSIQEPEDVARIMALIPVEPRPALSRQEFTNRVEQLVKLFGVEAISDGKGVWYVGGLDPRDDALVHALSNLLERRFPIELEH